MNLLSLAEPFKPSDIEWRVQQSGDKNGAPWAMVLAYVTNRAIQQRLDDVCGPENWKNEYTDGPQGGVLCGISIKYGGEWITKYDGAENTDIEKVKGGLSDSMKRAAVQWGIGRYLYKLDVGWANFSASGKYSSKISGTYHKWDAPDLPPWALPKPQTISVSEIEESLKCAKSITELAAVWKKAASTLKALPANAMGELEQLKDSRKAEFEAAQ